MKKQKKVDTLHECKRSDCTCSKKYEWRAYKRHIEQLDHQRIHRENLIRARSEDSIIMSNYSIEGNSLPYNVETHDEADEHKIIENNGVNLHLIASSNSQIDDTEYEQKMILDNEADATVMNDEDVSPDTAIMNDEDVGNPSPEENKDNLEKNENLESRNSGTDEQQEERNEINMHLRTIKMQRSSTAWITKKCLFPDGHQYFTIQGATFLNLAIII
jgi:hypothetical protein